MANNPDKTYKTYQTYKTYKTYKKSNMKKILTTLLVAVLLIGSSALLIAQNHRHNHDDQNIADSLVNEALADREAGEANNNFDFDINDAIQEYGNNNSYDNNYSSFDESGIAKLAITMVFGTLIVMFIAPVLIIGIILYYIYKRKQSKDRITMAAIEKGVDIPSENHAAATGNGGTYSTSETNGNARNNSAAIYNTAEKDKISARKEKPMMERGIMKVAIGIGLYCAAKIMHINILGAISLFVIIYGIGQIVIAYIYRDKDK